MRLWDSTAVTAVCVSEKGNYGYARSLTWMATTLLDDLGRKRAGESSVDTTRVISGAMEGKRSWFGDGVLKLWLGCRG